MKDYVLMGRGDNVLVKSRRSLGPLELTFQLALLPMVFLYYLSFAGSSATGGDYSPSSPQNVQELKDFVPLLEDVKAKIASKYIDGTAQPNADERTQDLHAFGIINEFRERNGRQALAWDENIYRLASHRSDDMEKNGYFDHLDPEGRCAKTIASDYNLTYSALAENIYGVVINCSCEYAAYPEDAVDYWKSSRSHRYNLLYEHHSAGALACIKSRCTFIAASNFGGETIDVGEGAARRIEALGSGECKPAEDGEAFWADAPPQTGEILPPPA